MDSKYRFTLDPSPRKFICPSCNKKRFVRYIDIMTREYFPNSSNGRCDSESSCGYFKGVELGTPAYRVEFLLCQTISGKAYKLTEQNYRVHIVPKSVVKENEPGAVWLTEWFLDGSTLPKTGEPKYFEGKNTIVMDVMPIEVKLPTYHNPELLEAESVTCNLTRFLLNEFPKEEVDRVKELYRVKGTNTPWRDSTIYYQIDLLNRIRGGKILHYGTDGKRTKDPYPRINWMHKVLNLDSFNLDQCLYGLHLTKQFPNKEIRLLESEKACLIMSLRQPQYNWMATGSLSGLKPKFLEAIKDRSITVFPDKGSAYTQWVAKAEVMNREGYNITVNPILESTDLKDGSGLDDLIIIQ